MLVKLYQVFDNVSGCVVGPIMVERSDKGAIRQFESALLDKSSRLNPHKDDYDLLCVGQQDDVTGAIGGDPYRVIEGSQIVELGGNETR